ncbi:hypothetical protein QT987_23800 [Microcoleus sp. SVA1B4]|uniref:hypothetical protein n=1 Tax=Microcoleus sp. B4-C5 TaxID=2818664 RepID=UPI002FCFD337
MPVPQRGNFIVGWAGYPVKNGQDARSTKRKFYCGWIGYPVKNGQDARSTQSKFYCGLGILPGHEKFIDNGAISQFLLA